MTQAITVVPPRIRRGLVTALALAALALLAGCGGGGGSPTPPGAAAGGGSGDGPSPGTFSSSARNAAFTADAGEVVTASQAVAQSNPVFGSVRQSGGSLSPVTDVTVTRRQADRTFDIVVVRQDGSRTTLNTGRHLVATLPVDAHTGRRAVAGALLDSDATRITAAAGLIDADPNVFGDWLVGGYWLHITGDWEAGTVTGAEVGAFIEGPELTDTTVPIRGTASYNGLAAGLYAALYGTDAAAAAGTRELGDYIGDFQATADFAAGTVSGTITNIRVVGIATTPDGRLYAVPLQPGNVRVELESGPIDATNGRIGPGTVRLVSLDPNLPFTSQQGSWGSRLSSEDDGDDNPRALAGTHAGWATTDGGTEVVYIGAHFGTTGDFE